MLGTQTSVFCTCASAAASLMGYLWLGGGIILVMLCTLLQGEQEMEIVKALGEHIGAILVLAAILIASLITIVGWFVKRTLGKLEDNIDSTLKTVIKHDRYLERIITSHRLQHGDDLAD
jgi:CDP-diglyceride synthetase